MKKAFKNIFFQEMGNEYERSFSNYNIKNAEILFYSRDWNDLKLKYKK